MISWTYQRDGTVEHVTARAVVAYRGGRVNGQPDLGVRCRSTTRYTTASVSRPDRVFDFVVWWDGHDDIVERPGVLGGDSEKDPRRYMPVTRGTERIREVLTEWWDNIGHLNPKPPPWEAP